MNFLFDFLGTDDKDLYKKINLGYFEVPSHVPYGAERLIKNILKVRPSERLTTAEVILFFEIILLIL